MNTIKNKISESYSSFTTSGPIPQLSEMNFVNHYGVSRNCSSKVVYQPEALTEKFKSKGLRRLMHLAGVVASPIFSVLNITFGLILSVPGLVGMVPFCGDTLTPLRQKSFKLLTAGSGGLLAIPFYSLLKFINPEAKINCGKKEITITDMIWNRIEPQADKLNKQGVLGSLASRGVYVALLITTIVTRVFDLVVAVILVPASLLTGGKFKVLNESVFKGLGVGAVVKDIYYCTLKIINPSIKFSNTTDETASSEK